MIVTAVVYADEFGTTLVIGVFDDKDKMKKFVDAWCVVHHAHVDNIFYKTTTLNSPYFQKDAMT